MITTFIASAIRTTANNYGLPGVHKGGFTWVINNIGNAMLAVIATAAVLFMIIGAFQYVLAAGNEELAEKGKKSIKWAIIGLLLAIFAWSIINLLVTSAPLSNETTIPAVPTTSTTVPAVAPGTAPGTSTTGTPAGTTTTGTAGAPPTTPTGATTGATTPPTTAATSTIAECNVMGSVLSLAREIKNKSSIVLSTSNVSIPNSSPSENIADLAAGSCPVTEDHLVAFATDGSGCELDHDPNKSYGPEKDPKGYTENYLNNANESLAGLLALVGTGRFNTVNVKSLFGGNHQCFSHRQMNAVDIDAINGLPVSGEMDNMCTIAQDLLDRSEASLMYGPDEAVDTCDIPQLRKWPGHATHFHLQW